ncbi:unnamed protein product [Musa hybrid cultivar]
MAEKLAPDKRHSFSHGGQKVFEWDQTLDEVNIYIDLPANVPKKLFYCKIQSAHIELGIKGNPPYLNHDLACPVKTDSSFWTLGNMSLFFASFDFFSLSQFFLAAFHLCFWLKSTNRLLATSKRQVVKVYCYQLQLKHFDQWFRLNKVDRPIRLSGSSHDIWYQSRSIMTHGLQPSSGCEGWKARNRSTLPLNQRPIHSKRKPSARSFCHGIGRIGYDVQEIHVSYTVMLFLLQNGRCLLD